MKFGWLLTGRLPYIRSTTSNTSAVSVVPMQDYFISIFFNDSNPYHSLEETNLKKQFHSTISRNKTGRFIVTIQILFGLT